MIESTAILYIGPPYLATVYFLLPTLFFASHDDQDNTTKNGRQGNGLFLFGCGLKRSDIHHLLPGCIGDTLIGERHDRKGDQDNTDDHSWLHRLISLSNLNALVASSSVSESKGK